MAEPHELVAMMPFAAHLGIELIGATPEEVTGRLAWREELCTTAGLRHGGALMALADSLAGVCALLNLPQDAGTATISSTTNFLTRAAGRLRQPHRPAAARRAVRDRHRDRAARRRRQAADAHHPVPGRAQLTARDLTACAGSRRSRAASAGR